MASISDSDATNSNNDLSDDDNTFNDEQVTGDEQQAVSPLFQYSSHVAAVCDAMNATTRKRSNSQVSGMTREERRREANRLSARRCRKRRKEELEQADDEIRRLSNESTKLTEANAVLRNQFREEVMKTLSETNSSPPAVSTTLQQVLPKVPEDSNLRILLEQHYQARDLFANRSQTMQGSTLPLSAFLGFGSRDASNPTNLPSFACLENLRASSVLNLGEALDSSTVALLHARNLLSQGNETNLGRSPFGLSTNTVTGLNSNDFGKVLSLDLAHSNLSSMATGFDQWLVHSPFATN